ncbi:MAG: hypothetical protein KUG77_11105 [Nannocystaceae bacterium]|nr:hypothetical protein [Nannocystaceae bacterium]
MNTRLFCISLAWLVPGCGSTAAPEPVTLDFQGERDLLDGFEQDSGFLPAGSPAAIRVVAGATASLAATAQATAVGDTLTPVAGTGSLAMEAGLSLEVSARIDAAGVEYEGVVETFEYAIEPAMTSFEPFSIGETVTLQSALPPGELARVPVPSVPGATLVLDIAGGQVNAAYSGVCATAMGGVAQYTAEAVIDGTIAIEGTIELEILVLSETFGPFSIEVPIPATTTTLDLGTFSTADGTAADGSPCDGVSGDTDAVSPMTVGGSTGISTTTSGSTAGEETTNADSTMGGGSTGEETSSPETGSSSTGCDAPGGCEGECVDDFDCVVDDACVDNECVPLPAECVSSLDCDACPTSQSCSFCVQTDDNACGDVANLCFFDDDCLTLVDCVNQCDDQPCADVCGAMSTPEAIEMYNAVASCVSDACS